MKQYDTYKDSGVQWLGEIPGHWEKKRLAALFTGDVDSNKDFRFKHAFKFNYGSLVLKDEIGDPEEYRDIYVKYSIVNKGDILINGLNLNYDFISQRVACAPSDGIITSAYVVCRPRTSVNYDYYTYLFKSMDCMKLFHGMGTGIRLTLSFKELKRQLLPVPPLSEQRSIVSYLDDKCGKIDEWVTKKQKEVEHLQELKQRVIADAVTRGLNPHVKMKATNIPWLKEIPEHWEMSKISSHFRQRNEKVSDKDYPALSVSKQGVTPQLDNVALSNAEGTSRKLVKVGDYAVNSRSDRKGSCGVSKYEGSVSLITIVLEPFNINGEYVHYLFRSNPWVEEFYRNGRGIVADLWTTNYQMMKSMYMPVPPIEEQKQIVSYLDAKTFKIDKLIAHITKEIECIKEYKQRLISDVVTGQIKVC